MTTQTASDNNKKSTRYTNHHESSRDEKLARPPHILTDPDYYRISLVHRLRDIKIPRVSSISEVHVKPEIAGLMDRSALFRVKLYDEKHGFIGSLFAKTIYEGRKQTYLSPQPLDPRSSMRYQFEQMLEWDRLRLPAARAIDYIEEMRDVSPSEISEKDIVKVDGILFEDITSPTHDLDLIAINQIVQYNTRQLLHKDPFLPSSEKEMLERANEYLFEERNKILDSVLSNVNHFAVFGTISIPGDKVIVSDNPGLDYFERFEHYMNKALFFTLIRRGELDIDQYRQSALTDNFGHLSKTALDSLGDLNDKLKNLRDPLLKILEDLFSRRLVYRQGDEYLHHYAYHEINGTALNPNETILGSVVFDADRATIGPIEGAQSKVLVNPISVQEIEYEEAASLVQKANRELMALATQAEQTHPSEYAGIRGIVELDPAIALKRFDFMAIYEIFRCMGKRAIDALKNWNFHDARIRKGAPYDNRFIEYPKEVPEHLTLTRVYDIPRSIDKLRGALIDRFDRIRQDSVDYEITKEEKEALQGLEALAFDVGILVK